MKGVGKQIKMHQGQEQSENTGRNSTKKLFEDHKNTKKLNKKTKRMKTKAASMSSEMMRIPEITTEELQTAINRLKKRGVLITKIKNEKEEVSPRHGKEWPMSLVNEFYNKLYDEDEHDKSEMDSDKNENENDERKFPKPQQMSHRKQPKESRRAKQETAPESEPKT